VGSYVLHKYFLLLFEQKLYIKETETYGRLGAVLPDGTVMKHRTLGIATHSHYYYLFQPPHFFSKSREDCSKILDRDIAFRVYL
jgi:hypothetical protein